MTLCILLRVAFWCGCLWVKCLLVCSGVDVNYASTGTLRENNKYHNAVPVSRGIRSTLKAVRGIN